MSADVKQGNERPVAVKLREAARLLSISERTLWSMAQAGNVPCRRIRHGTKTLYLFSVAELERWARGDEPQPHSMPPAPMPESRQ